MKRAFFTLILSCCSLFSLYAQENTLNGMFYNEERHIQLKLNLDAKNIPVPGLEVDSCYGYVRGNVNGMWVILKIKNRSEKRALVRAISERGADAQDLDLQLTDEGVILRQVNGAYIKGIADRKYVKLPKELLLSK